MAVTEVSEIFGVVRISTPPHVAAVRAMELDCFQNLWLSVALGSYNDEIFSLDLGIEISSFAPAAT